MLDVRSAIQMFAMCAPAANDPIRPMAGFDQLVVILWPNRIAGLAHQLGMCLAPSEDVYHAKSPKTQLASAPFTALDGRIVLLFCGF